MKYLLNSLIILTVTSPMTLFASNFLDQFPGQSLKKDMFLKYRSSDGSKPIYKVLDVRINFPNSDTHSCSQISMSYDGSSPTTRVECLLNSYLYEAKNAKQELLKSRPIHEHLTLEKRDDAGILKSKYVTSTFDLVNISGREVKVINTVIYFYRKSGEIHSRLVEQYAPLYSTATSGKFESPDPNVENGWRTDIEFFLESIE